LQKLFHADVDRVRRVLIFVFTNDPLEGLY